MDSSDKKDNLNVNFHFPTAVYSIEKPEFLNLIKDITDIFIEKTKKEVKVLDEIYPVYMTEDLRSDERIKEFCSYVADTAWNILENQGYAMNNLHTYFTDLWCQEHYKHSSMEQHVHNYGAQIVGFYFIDCPENGSKVLFHDPKPAKVQISLQEQDQKNATYASNIINFEPKPGTLMFTNSWLPHSFTKNSSDKPFRFIHFNIATQAAPIKHSSQAEVI